MANHWGLPTLAGSAQASTIDDWVTTLINAIDNMAKFQSGTLASRPSASSANVGLYYLASDTGVTYLSDGTQWVDLSRGTVPIGGMIDWPGTGEPSDTRFMLADGRSLLRASYPDLFTSLGGASSPWGLPDGTHFNIPDTRGRVTVAPDNMGTATGAANRLTANRTIAAAAGEEKHALTAAENGPHTHGPGSQTKFIVKQDSNLQIDFYPTYNDYPSSTLQFYGQTTTSTSSSGSGTPHNVMQPFVIASKIIRVL